MATVVLLSSPKAAATEAKVEEEAKLKAEAALSSSHPALSKRSSISSLKIMIFARI